VADIQHVVVLVLENRSFDHMLGLLDHPNPDFDGLRGRHSNPAWPQGEEVVASGGAKAVLPVDPDHSHDAVMEQLALRGGRPTNQGFVASYEKKGQGISSPSFGGLLAPLVNWWKGRGAAPKSIVGRGPLIMRCQEPERVPVLSRLALEYAVCTRWFCSVPGETWPNRNFMHAATADGETDIDIRFFTDPTIFEQLEEHGQSWHIYHDDTPQVWAYPNLWDRPDRHARWFPHTEFIQHARAGTLPAYSFIEPNHRPPIHTVDRAPATGTPGRSNSQHPGNNMVGNDAYDAHAVGGDTDFARAETLIADVYEALRANKDAFERTLLLITYDEHGGFYDHVPPPTGVPAPGDPVGGLARLFHLLYHRKTAAFDFTMLGPRVPAILVSPFIPKGTVDAETRDHASIPATLRAIFAPDAKPLTGRDAWAPVFHKVLTLPEARYKDLPDLSAYAPTPPTAAEQVAPPVDRPVPQHYEAFAEQAELVLRGLLAVEEPEVSGITADASTMRRVAATSAAFIEAARRHRSP
jgi:phospholipase C